MVSFHPQTTDDTDISRDEQQILLVHKDLVVAHRFPINTKQFRNFILLLYSTHHHTQQLQKK